MTSLTLPVPSTLPSPWRAAAELATLLRRRQPTAPQLATALVTVLAMGIGVSILTTTDPFWWRLHFSELGTFHDFSGMVFNVTLIAAGAVIVAFALRVHRDLATLAARGHRRPRLLVAFMISGGVELAVVGIVPVDTLTFVHDRAASGVMMSFAAVLITVGREWRMLPAALRRMTVVVALSLGTATPVFIAGFINLAAFEAVGFTLIFVWLGVFTNSLHATAVHEAEAAGLGETADASTAQDAASASAPAPLVPLFQETGRGTTGPGTLGRATIGRAGRLTADRVTAGRPLAICTDAGRTAALDEDTAAPWWHGSIAPAGCGRGARPLPALRPVAARPSHWPDEIVPVARAGFAMAA